MGKTKQPDLGLAAPFPEDFLRHVEHNRRRAVQRAREDAAKAAKNKGETK